MLPRVFMLLVWAAYMATACNATPAAVGSVCQQNADCLTNPDVLRSSRSRRGEWFGGRQRASRDRTRTTVVRRERAPSVGSPSRRVHQMPRRENDPHSGERRDDERRSVRQGLPRTGGRIPATLSGDVTPIRMDLWREYPREDTFGVEVFLDSNSAHEPNDHSPETLEPPTMVRCPRCCDDARAEPDETCTLCKGRGRVSPTTAALWRDAQP